MRNPKTHQTGRRVHFIAATPPPVNGMTLMSAAMRDALSETGFLSYYPVTNLRGLKGVRWSILKHLQIWRCVRQASRAAHSADVCYMVPDSVHGLILNRIEMRHLTKHFAHVFLHHHVSTYVNKRDPHMAAVIKRLGSAVTHIVLGPEMEHGLRTQYGQDIKTLTLGNAALVPTVTAPRLRSQLDTVGYLSHVSLPKGIDRFMETVRAVDRAGHKINAVIAGPFADQETGARVQAFIAQNPETRRYAGPVYDAQKETFWDQIDVLLFPSRYAQEAQPVTIFEALTQAIPVLATPRGCIPSQLYGTGWVLPEDRFVQQACDQIVAWRNKPDAYKAAVTHALSLWDDHQKTDAARLLDVVNTITQKHMT